ncbi:MAG TPA: PfkB family carbohydrate kinase [Methanobacterium sp.]|nr:PfkB family carbohydrate kinase [Methanobacterium sp.]
MIMGPVTKDRIIKKDKIFNTVGGGVYYQSAVISGFEIQNTVVTTLSKIDKNLLQNFREDVQIIPVYTEKTMKFENIYPNDNPNHRIQKSQIPVNPINPPIFSDMNIKEYDAILLSPLSPYDIPLETVKYLHKQNIPIYLGAQGYLRHIKNDNVVLKPWKDYKNFLKLVNYLFLDEMEARVILGNSHDDFVEIAKILSNFGPEEVVITRGDRGVIIYSKKTVGKGIYDISAFKPEKIVDPTGLGDTFMAAYAVKKQETDDPEKCGRFASYVATLKIGQKGALFKINKR